MVQPRHAPAESRVAAALRDIERALTRDGALAERLRLAISVLGRSLGASEVVIYGNSEPGDAAVRVRERWTAEGDDTGGQPRSGTWMRAVPLLIDRPRGLEMVASAPRGNECPENCEDTHPDCALRDHCATLTRPLQVADDSFGSLAVHQPTGHIFGGAERSLTQQAAYRIALEIARHRNARMRDDLEVERQTIATTALHQLATPVTVLSCVIEQIGSLNAAGNQQMPGLERMVRMARAECARLRRLCDDIRVLVSSDTALDSATSDVVSEVAIAVNNAREAHPGAVIAITVVGEIPPARCGSRPLQRIMQELIDNALRYCPPPVRIDLMVATESGRVAIRLRDNGPGLTQGQADRLGHAFTRLDPDMLTQPGGTGLGLAIARQLATQTGGELSLGPRTDAQGTQVTLFLPADEGNERTIVADDRST